MDPLLTKTCEPLTVATEEDTRTKELQLLNAIAQIATTDLELRPMLQRITDALASKFDWQVVTLATIDSENQTFVCEAVTSSIATEVHVGYNAPLGTGVVGEVAVTHRPAIVDDVRTRANYIDITPGARSEISVPITHKGELVAILNIESTRLAAFHDALDLLETVADQIAGAIASARMYDELKQHARLMEMMSEISRTSLEAQNLEDFLNRTAQYVYDRFPLEIATILLHDPKRHMYTPAATVGRADATQVGDLTAPSVGVVGRAILTGQTKLVADVRSDPEYVRINPNVAAELVVPIRFRDEVLGAFNLESRSSELFNSTNVLAFEALASQIAGALKLQQTSQELAETKKTLEKQKRDLQDGNVTLTRMVEKMEVLSTHDSLTGLANRREFDRAVYVEWRRGARTCGPLSLLFADIDAFKAYNDLLGHSAGDDCLRHVARAIRDTVQRAGDLVVRYGGEEFAILLPHTDLESAAHIAELVRRRVSGLAIVHPAAPAAEVITVSLGVATAIPGTREEDIRLLIEAADRALYVAKGEGRNRVAVSGRPPALSLKSRS